MMTMHSEFDLLCIADDIEPGDRITVEDEDGTEQIMVFVKVLSRKFILKDSEGLKWEFSTATLESLIDTKVVMGKSHEEED